MRWVAPLLLLVMRCASAPSPTAETDLQDDGLADYAALGVGRVREYAVRYPGQQGKLRVETTERREGWFLDDRGARLRLASDGLRDEDRYLIRRPLVAGTRWRSVLSASAVEHYEIKSVGQPCAVPAGRFRDCLVVEARLRRDDSMELEAEWLWIRGVGLARIRTVARVQGRRIPQTVQELVGYDFSPPRGAP
ncbi:MAG: hypothetical protein AAGD10_05240 [Myxococcota bacterium]